MIDLRFPTALQIMLLLAVADQSGVTSVSSQQLAQGVGVHSSLVRKLLLPLIESGLVVSTKGKNGGVRLARSAEAITLQEIYRGIIGDKKLWEARLDGPRTCLVSSNTVEFFEALASDAEKAVLDLLGTRTLAGSLAELELLDKAKDAAPSSAE